MDDTSWVVPGIFALIILIVLVVFAAHTIMGVLQARQNRTYKSLDQHRAANTTPQPIPPRSNDRQAG